MVTASNHMRALTQNPGGRCGSFETRDFYLACFLRCAGYELLDLRAEGTRKVFVFQDGPRRRDDVIAFYGETGNVRPLAFATAIKDMKALLHNA
jgi:hypothetical protein